MVSAWVICGLLGGVSLARYCLPDQHTRADRILTVCWALGLGVMFGFFALLFMGGADDEEDFGVDPLH